MLLTLARTSEGQLGSGRLETSVVPRFVHALQGNFVDAIACGYNFSMAVTQKVCVCVCVCVCVDGWMDGHVAVDRHIYMHVLYVYNTCNI